MFDVALYTYILSEFSLTGDFRYGSANDSDPPYIVQVKVSDLERPETLCDKQGDSGRALLQYTASGGGAQTTTPMESIDVVQYLEAFKNQMQLLKGVIGAFPDDYRIWNNITGSVRPLNEGSNTTGIWGAFFESEIWWEKL